MKKRIPLVILISLYISFLLTGILSLALFNPYIYYTGQYYIDYRLLLLCFVILFILSFIICFIISNNKIKKRNNTYTGSYFNPNSTYKTSSIKCLGIALGVIFGFILLYVNIFCFYWIGMMLIENFI